MHFYIFLNNLGTWPKVSKLFLVGHKSCVGAQNDLFSTVHFFKLPLCLFYSTLTTLSPISLSQLEDHNNITNDFYFNVLLPHLVFNYLVLL